MHPVRLAVAAHKNPESGLDDLATTSSSLSALTAEFSADKTSPKIKSYRDEFFGRESLSCASSKSLRSEDRYPAMHNLDSPILFDIQSTNFDESRFEFSDGSVDKSADVAEVEVLSSTGKARNEHCAAIGTHICGAGLREKVCFFPIIRCCPPHFLSE